MALKKKGPHFGEYFITDYVESTTHTRAHTHLCGQMSRESPRLNKSHFVWNGLVTIATLYGRLWRLTRAFMAVKETMKGIRVALRKTVSN